VQFCRAQPSSSIQSGWLEHIQAKSVALQPEEGRACVMHCNCVRELGCLLCIGMLGLTEQVGKSLMSNWARATATHSNKNPEKRMFD
jgi:hypothetical protein